VARSRRPTRLSGEGGRPGGASPTDRSPDIVGLSTGASGVHQEAGRYCRLPSGNSITQSRWPCSRYRRTTGRGCPTSGWPGCTTIIRPRHFICCPDVPVFAWSPFVHVDDRCLVDRGLGFLDYGCQRGALHLLLAYHRAQRQPHLPQVLQQLLHFPPAQPVAATQQSDHGGQTRTERPPGHPHRQVRPGPLPAGGAAPHRHLVLGYPDSQRQQLHDLVSPGPATATGRSPGERLPTMPAPLRLHRDDCIHLFDRQQPSEGPRCPGCPPRFRPDG
jgi:hypothetical protein